MMHLLLHAPWRPMPATLAAVVAGCACLMTVCGLLGTEKILRARPARHLRDL
jgi:predicted lysophospholipase L1 biosynthesis ABC-type transport system permease subunit